MKGDRAAGEHDECERGVSGVKPVGAAGDQTDLVVERFGAALVDPETNRGEDPGAVFADRFGEPGEGLEAAAGEAAEEAIDEDRDVLERQAGLKDRADGFLERVGAPYFAAGGL